MRALKYSRQRESIKEFLSSRKDHPTADMVYENLRMQYPNISLGTVYRNLALLSSMGEILKLTTGSGPDRFDGNVHPHYHFTCTNCNSVIDLELERPLELEVVASKDFDGEIQGHIAYFYGICPECKASTQ